MKADEPKLIHRKDYRPTDYIIDRVGLTVALNPSATRVRAELDLFRRAPGDGPLKLDGIGLALKQIAVDGAALAPESYRVEPDGLVLLAPPEKFRLTTEVEIDPAGNTALEGLYMSNGRFCTQCEAEGFRHITYYLDRPDVLSVFRVRIEADREEFPVLLSNGNLESEGALENGRHFAEWHDPFPKPSYLFALVAGDLGHVEDSFTTMSGRSIRLRIYVEPGKEDRCTYAMDALKRAMHWDEEVYGREYDLDLFNIVAVSDFNMGAMENKGLNIFNDALLLASPETATDTDYATIEAVVAHEYFHNWTGNRITCRDWFQLSLKEGLTVFREQQFSADMRSAAVKRIQDARELRQLQFAEDAGPLAHPVRPESYAKIENFYTDTVYDKGAEVIRMLYNILGAKEFRKGTDLYFERHDGAAVTIEDWVKAFEDACGRDLGQFRRWYAQAGTPHLSARGVYDAAAGTYDLTLQQDTPPTPGQPEKEPLVIPVAAGLIGGGGQSLALDLEDGGTVTDGTCVLELTEHTRTFRFRNVPEPPTPSLLRGFSAPVTLRVDLGESERLRIIAHDPDPFSRWDTAQRFARDLILGGVAVRAEGREMSFPAAFGQALRDTLLADGLDPAFKALMLNLPTETELALHMDVVDVDGIHEAREALKRAILYAHVEDLSDVYQALSVNEPYDPGAAAAGRRALRNAALILLCSAETDASRALALNHYRNSSNMTDAMAGLSVLAGMESAEAEAALEEFHERWRGDPLVVNKWLSLHAMSPRPDTLERVKALLNHPSFSIANPNKVRSLIGAFTQANPLRFHTPGGDGYRFFAETLVKLDRLNPLTAARQATAFKDWRRYDPARRELMRQTLEQLQHTEGLSDNTREVVHRSLGG